jgi:hypothetical protein
MDGFSMRGSMPRRLAEGAMRSAWAVREVMRSFRLNYQPAIISSVTVL